MGRYDQGIHEQMRRIIASRDNLVNLLGECPRRPIERAVLTDDVECLGQFSQVVPGKPRPAWMFIARGESKTYNVAAILRDRGKTIGFRVLKDIPWQWWNSDNSKGLKAGDDPIKYIMLRAGRIMDETVSKDMQDETEDN